MDKGAWRATGYEDRKKSETTSRLTLTVTMMNTDAEPPANHKLFSHGPHTSPSGRCLSGRYDTVTGIFLTGTRNSESEAHGPGPEFVKCQNEDLYPGQTPESRTHNG